MFFDKREKESKTMKKIIMLMFAMILLSFCCGCSIKKLGLQSVMMDTDNKYLEGFTNTLFEALEKKDKDTLMKMFSKNARTEAKEFEASVNELFEYFDGEVIDYIENGRHTSDSMGDEKYIIYDLSFDIKTDVQEYRLAMIHVREDRENEDNVGISSLYIIIKNEDTDLKYRYYGDDLNTLGINIGVKNVLWGDATE